MKKSALAIGLTVLMIVGAAAPALAAAPASGAEVQPDGVMADKTPGVSISDGGTSPDIETQPTDQAAIDDSLEQAEGTVEVVLRLDSVDQSSLRGLSDTQAVEMMMQHADETQQDALRYAYDTEGVEVLKRLWIANAILLEVNTDEVSIERLTRINNVDRVHANFDLTLPTDPEQSESRADGPSADAETTYGLDQINAPEVWEEYDTKGDGVGVAVLDTGVDPDHPDIDIDPENFVEVTDDGEVENVDPFDSDDHGTHTSGTVTGGDASGEYIGVAPDATLYHGLVIPGGGGSFTQVAAGMEWAANEPGVDVVSMSLGADGYFTEMIEPTQNIEAAGKILVASAGNSGEGASGSPGNVYEAIAAGASNEDLGIAAFSSGEEVDTSEAWGDAAPADWPDNYVVPDYAAPGVAVKSALPGGGYGEKSGTSMAAPHISGAVALMLAAGGDIDQSTVEEALTDTAFAPVDDPDPVRYGDGIIDVKAATDQVALEQEITGTVTEADSDVPIEGATVSTDQGFDSVTNADGEYTTLADVGTVEVTADAFGYDESSATVEVGDEETVTQDFGLDPALDLQLLQGQPDAIEGGESATAVVQAANLESYTAELGDGYDEADATLYVNGDEVPWGESVTFSEPTDVTAEVTVETAAGTSGELSVVHTFEGLGSSVEVTTGPTDVYEEFTQVGIVTDEGSYGDQITATLSEQLPASYAVDVLTSSEAIDSTEEYDSYVVNNLDEENAEAFVSATNDYSTGVVYLDQWGSYSNGIEMRSDVLGDPAETADGFSNENPTYVNVADHPIFEGVGEGPIQLHTASFSDKMWFSDTDATVLADVSNGEVQGAGVAVDSDRWDILGGSLGYETFVEGEDYTEEADTILGNMVEVASNPPEPVGTVTVTDTVIGPEDESAEVTLQTDVDSVAGYEATVSFDASKLQVESVDGIDMDDPAVSIDNEDGSVTLSQAQANGADAPVMAQITFEVVEIENGDEASLMLDASSSAIYDESGSAYLTNFDDGTVSVLSSQLGDVNADGEITAGDAVIAQRYIAGLPTEVPGEQIETLGDVNQDGTITSADVTAILQIVIGNEEPPESEDDERASLVTNAAPAAQIAG